MTKRDDGFLPMTWICLADDCENEAKFFMRDSDTKQIIDFTAVCSDECSETESFKKHVEDMQKQQKLRK